MLTRSTISPDLAAELLATGRALADAARAATLPHFRTAGLAAENKLDSGFDPVTIADREAETAMRVVLADRRPEDSILGEEHGVTERQEAGDAEHQVVAEGVDGENEDLDRQALEEAGVSLAVLDHGRDACAVDQDRHQEGERQDETGEGDGNGYNQNLVYPPGTPFEVWREGLETACQRITEYQPEALVIALGVDTFEDDPISFFKLTSADYLLMGERLAKLNLPTLFTMEGGYDVDAIGVNVVNVLKGFERGRL